MRRATVVSSSRLPSRRAKSVNKSSFPMSYTLVSFLFDLQMLCTDNIYLRSLLGACLLLQFSVPVSPNAGTTNR